MNRDLLLRFTSHSLGLATAGGIVAFAVVGQWALTPDQRQKANVLRQVTMAKWSLPKLGRASAVTLTVRNASKFSIKDVTVTCNQVTPAGKVRSETRTIPEQIKAQSSRIIAFSTTSLRLSTAAVLSCNVDDVQIAALQRLASTE